MESLPLNKGVILKLDFEKAFDSVNWNFLLDLLNSFGFGSKWLSWIKECISTATISVLINGSPSDQFRTERGIRQGDPLSPFLFNIVAEGLSILFRRAMAAGLVNGVRIGSSGPVLSYLQFADDTIIFCEASMDEEKNIKNLLRCFELLSGLKTNLHKSSLSGVGIDETVLKEFADVLKCKVQNLLIKYLGLPLGASPRSCATWKAAIDNFKKKLTLWKSKFLSFEGRVTLIKFVLCSLPVYYLSIFKMPEMVAKELDMIKARFLWGGSDSQRKMHLVC